jgi:hypothetical protein
MESTKFNPKCIAECLTILEWKIFSSIDRNELCHKKWDGHNKAGSKIVSMIDRSNAISLWCASLILGQKEKSRISAVKGLIILANVLFYYFIIVTCFFFVFFKAL